MKTFKHAMGDVVVVPQNNPGEKIEGVIVGRCEYAEGYDPNAPQAETHYYCVRTYYKRSLDWKWYPQSEVKDPLS
jgi:hypothetical protein